MGIYNFNENEIADILENCEDEGKFDGDFSESIFIKGAKLFIKRLRKQGASIPK
jgi:hypothetical protein